MPIATGDSLLHLQLGRNFAARGVVENRTGRQGLRACRIGVVARGLGHVRRVGSGTQGVYELVHDDLGIVGRRVGGIRHTVHDRRGRIFGDAIDMRLHVPACRIGREVRIGIGERTEGDGRLVVGHQITHLLPAVGRLLFELELEARHGSRFAVDVLGRGKRARPALVCLVVLVDVVPFARANEDGLGNEPA